jgi:hypothetical protein
LARVSHEAINPVAVGVEQTKQASTMRQAEKEMLPVILQPAIESVIATPFKGKKQGNCDSLTGCKGGLGMFRRVKHLVIHLAEQFNDKIFGRHWILLSGFGLSPSE